MVAAAAGSSGASAGSSGSNASATAAVTVVASKGLSRPTDLEFNPLVPDQLWVVSHADSSVLIVEDASLESRTQERRLDPEARGHFMPLPTALAFGASATSFVDARGKKVEGTFATCPESTHDFMGPTLWTSDLRIFAIAKPAREAPFNGPTTGAEGPGSHIDMLHRTPACAGIAWEGAGNVYWTYSGVESMLVRYDFASDHHIGNADHSDGSVWRYAVSGIGYVSKTPSHLAYRKENKLVYLADTGNGRVVTFDPASATGSANMPRSENVDGLAEAKDMIGGKVTELVGSAKGLRRPSGLEIYDSALYVTDSETSTIHKFSLDGTPLAAVRIDSVETGGLAGLNFAPDGKLYFVDMVASRVLRLDTKL